MTLLTQIPVKKSKLFVQLSLLVAAITLSGPATWAANSTVDLPDLGDSSATLLSAEEDQRLGQAFMRSLRQQLDLVEDPAINVYINALGYRLLGGANSELPFSFFVVNDPVINAFAGPGGYIGIHSGLILAAETEGELAAVMAHEIAHVTQRHLARAFQKASTANVQTAAAIIAAIILGGSNPQVAEAAIISATAGGYQQQLNFTRTHEREADRVGIDILAHAGYDPRNMPAFFYRLQESQRYMENNVPELLRTHPVTPARIADSKNRAEQFPVIKNENEKEFQLIQAHLRTLGGNAQDKARALDLAKSSPLEKRSIAELYELALWKKSSSEYQEAEKLSQRLLKHAPEKDLFIALQAEIEIAQNNNDAASQRLNAALKLYPQHPLLTTLYAEVLLANKQADQAALLMRDLIQHHKHFVLPAYYQLLAKAEAANNNPSDAYLALADYYYFIGQARTAIEQLKTALEKTPKDDSFRRERINIKLQDLQQEVLAEEQADH